MQTRTARHAKDTRGGGTLYIAFELGHRSWVPATEPHG
jgi:hypothetical protein